MPSRLDLANANCVLSLRAVGYLELNHVSCTELIEPDVHELVGMEEEILLHTLDLDETEAFLVESSDCSFLHRMYVRCT